MAAPDITITPPLIDRHLSRRTALLVCGILAPLLYAAMLVVIPLAWEGYSSTSQTVSELSAIDAPTRALWVPLGALYTLLLALFGWGVRGSASGARSLRLAGAVLIAAGVLGLFWPPMHLREVLAAGGATLSDTLHIVWTAMNGVLMMVAMGFAAAALGKPFRAYSIAGIALLLVTGGITSIDSPRLQANLPTPWMGAWERVNVAIMMLWLAVFAVRMLRRQEVEP